jgi:putative ABC transport system ATP-binding protein
MSTRKEILIHGKNVSLSFKVGTQEVKAIKGADFTIPKSEFTIIYGASGSGKSSLLNIVSGLQSPTSGSLKVSGAELYGQTANDLANFRASELGIVYQTNYWVKSLDVAENVALPLYFLGFSKHEAIKKAKTSLERVNMLEYANKYPALLSGGEQQRVAMARALVNDPPIIIADEPTGNLDSTNGDMIINLLQQLCSKQGKTIILVTHNMEYLAIATHLLEIQDGNVTEIEQSEIPKTVKLMLGDVRKRIEGLIGVHA